MQKTTPQVLPGPAHTRAGQLTTDDVAGVVEALTGERVTPRPDRHTGPAAGTHRKTEPRHRPSGGSLGEPGEQKNASCRDPDL